MIPKRILWKEEALEKMLKGLDLLAKTVGSTLGPRGRTVILESARQTAGRTVTKDGVTVANEVQLLDSTENIAVEIVRESAQKSVIDSGDGTTTTIVLTKDIIDQTLFSVERAEGDGNKVNKTKLLRAIDKYAKIAVTQIEKASKKLTKGRIAQVARVSGNNDDLVGDLVAEAFSKSKAVTFEKSIDMKTSVTTVDGLSISRGMTDTGFATSAKGLFEADEAYVLICNRKIKRIDEIEHLVRHCSSNKKPLVIVSDIEEDFLNALVLNHIKTIKGQSNAWFQFCHIIPPSFGAVRQDMMNDLAVATGATLFSDSTGDNLQASTLEDLGMVKNIKVSLSRTIFKRHPNIDETIIEDHMNDLKEFKSEMKNPADIAKMDERMDAISGGVSVISVGGVTPSEQKELFDRVEDAVKAVYAAKDEGIVAGGGIALLGVSQYLSSLEADSIEDDIAIEILCEAFKAPIKKIFENAGLDFADFGKNILDSNSGKLPKNYTAGYNLVNDEFGDMIKMGIIDPAKVTKSAITNAVSSSRLILGSDAVITNMREHESQ